jgi:hypothetical protein
VVGDEYVSKDMSEVVSQLGRVLTRWDCRDEVAFFLAELQGTNEKTTQILAGEEGVRTKDGRFVVYAGKKSNVHAAAVVGDTVGDPLKDTSGPALNIVMKLMAIISVLPLSLPPSSLRARALTPPPPLTPFLSEHIC